MLVATSVPPQLGLDRLLPELIVAGTGFAAIVTELLLPAGRRAVASGLTAFLGLAVAFVVLLTATPTGLALSVHAPARVGGVVQDVLITGWLSDAFSIYVRGTVLVTGMLLLLLSMRYLKRMDRGHGELTALLLFALLGVMLVSGVQDLLSFFVCLELVTIMSYVLAAFRRNDSRSTEAGLKYLVVGAVSTALLLLGIAFVYGHVGSLSFEAVATTLAGGEMSVFLGLGLVLVLVGLLFKVGGVPFHVWIPDVYQGAPTPVTAFLATASKAAGLVLLLRFGTIAFVGGGVAWVPILAVIAVATLVFGSLGALGQRNIKRMLGYSGIGHAGYLLMGITAMAAAEIGGRAADGPSTAILFYLLAYALTGLTAFAVVVLVAGASGGEHGGRAWRGLWKRSPFLAVAMLLALLSLAGVPPMSGFFAKFLVLKALVDQGLVGMAFLGAGAVIVGLYFYFLWMKEMYFKEPEPELEASPIHVPWSSRLALVIGILGMVGMGIFMSPFHTWAEEAAKALLATAR